MFLRVSFNKENIASMGKGATVKGITLDQLKAIKILCTTCRTTPESRLF